MHVYCKKNQKKSTVNGLEYSVGGGRIFFTSADISIATMVVCLQGNVKKKKGAQIKAALFKCLNTEKQPIMVYFDSDKQTKWVVAVM